MTRAPTRPEPAATTPTAQPIQIDSDASLSRAVDEAARLLQADGAMVYLVDGDRMRFAVDAGIQNAEAQQLIRDLSLPVGVGLFGHAVASGEVVVSADYRRDQRFPHSPIADRIVSVANMRSMAAAPLIADGEVLGALGAYSSRIDGFDESGIALLRALADHAATTIANQRLIERLARSQEELARLTDDLRGHADELAHRVEAQRTLAEMATQLTSLRDPSEVLVQTLREAVRLLKGDGGQIGMVTTDPDGKLRWGDGHSLVHGELTAFTKDDHTTVDDGVSGRALLER
jgi:transcriptional regulator with GAF, ATPase, and Fis domain